MCDECDFKTQGVKGIKVHLTTHGEKIKCEQCPYETTWKNLMKSHTEVKHMGLGHVCVICGARKSRKYYLEQHMKSKHK